MTRRTHLTRRKFLAASAATLAASQLRAAPANTPNFVYIGTTARGEGAGIYAANWNPRTASLSPPRLVAPADNAGFLASSNISGTRRLFAGHQLPNNIGNLSSWTIDPSGDLRNMQSITVPDFDFVHTAIDHTGRCLVTASYGSGKVLSVKVGTDGSLSAAVSLFQLTGHGPNASRQTSPHAHGVVFSPDNKFVLVNDLGTDRIMVYKLDPATAGLTANDPPFFAAAPGSGPRHTTFHPNGKWAYSVNEIDSTITQMSWNAATGALTLVATTQTLLPGGDVANNRAGELVFDLTGRTLYSCNRQAPDELLVYAVDPATGSLSLMQRFNFNGKEARHFALSPDGSSLLLAEQFSGEVAIFARDPATGTLKTTPHLYAIASPSCILFV